MLARVRLALVDVQFAPPAAKSFRTVADELIDAIFADAAIQARIRFAFVHVAQATGVEIAAWAVAFKPVHQVRTFSYRKKS